MRSNTANNELFTSMPVGRAVAKLAVPTVISQIIVILYSLADTFFVGQIGDPNQIAALSITFPIYTLLTAVANLFGIGANSVIARSLGQGNETTAKQASSFSFWGSLAVTLVLSVILGVFMEPILLFFGADPATHPGLHRRLSGLGLRHRRSAHGGRSDVGPSGPCRGPHQGGRHRPGTGRHFEHHSRPHLYFHL